MGLWACQSQIKTNDTHGSLLRSCMSYIRHVVVVHHSSWVPVIYTVNTFPSAFSTCETYKFDGNLLIIQQVGTLEKYTERAFTNLLSDSVVDTNHIGG